MVNHIYAGFLNDPDLYQQSEQHWLRFWATIDLHNRNVLGWRQPWFQPLPRQIAEGNPIFTAVSDRLRRAIRIIQHEPMKAEVEIQAWQDSFGGGVLDPDSYEELVISCSLSDRACDLARYLIIPWISGNRLQAEWHQTDRDSPAWPHPRAYDNGGILTPAA
jgi:hypothetical protein